MKKPSHPTEERKRKKRPTLPALNRSDVRAADLLLLALSTNPAGVELNLRNTLVAEGFTTKEQQDGAMKLMAGVLKIIAEGEAHE